MFIHEAFLAFIDLLGCNFRANIGCYHHEALLKPQECCRIKFTQFSATKPLILHPRCEMRVSAEHETCIKLTKILSEVRHRVKARSSVRKANSNWHQPETSETSLPLTQQKVLAKSN